LKSNVSIYLLNVLKPDIENVVLEKGDLNSGIYFIELRSRSKTLKDKVLIE
jgi:hypothetical protein